MKRTKTEELGNVIESFLNNSRLGDKMNESKAEDVWEEVAGPVLAKCATNVRVYKGVLHVHMTMAAARQELMMRKQETIDQMNEKLGKDVVKDIFIS